jgi:hypothetical protein
MVTSVTPSTSNINGRLRCRRHARRPPSRAYRSVAAIAVNGSRSERERVPQPDNTCCNSLPVVRFVGLTFTQLISGIKQLLGCTKQPIYGLKYSLSPV